MSHNLDKPNSDDEFAELQFSQFDTLLDEGAVCISDTESDDDVLIVGETPAKLLPISAPPQSTLAQTSHCSFQPALPPPNSATSQRSPHTILPQLSSRPGSARTSASPAQAVSPVLQYPTGVVRLTRYQDQPITSTTVSLSDLIQPNLQKAILSTFVLDLDWLLPHFADTTKLLIVKHYDPRIDRRGIYQAGRLTIVHPEFADQRFPIMHSKIMLMFYPRHIRLVISSANLLSIDWTALGNIVFIQDLPLLDEPRELYGFGLTLAQALRDLSVPEQAVGQLDMVDFSKVKAQLVTSVPSMAGRSKFHADAYGLARLAQVTIGIRKSLSPEQQRDWLTTHHCCYGSSMGKLTPEYLSDFYLSALGLDSAQEFRHLLSPATSTGSLSQRVHVGFHTQTQGKIILARFGEMGRNGWIYLGSHNFTPGAWGHLRGGSRATRKVYVNNYELGVVLPGVTFERIFGRDSVLWNGLAVPLPFKMDWEPYGRDELPLIS
ncbi:hypothetical protein GGF37_000806 [Kickxella alabastrina]|nr:hypothetical protein GGF37_000806 [Kickxella alabastrina]